MLLENISEITLRLHSTRMLRIAGLKINLQCPLASVYCGSIAFHDVPSTDTKIMQYDRHFKMALAKIGLIDLQGSLEKIPLFGCIPNVLSI